MAAWKHDYCGAVYNGAKNPPVDCGVCCAEGQVGVLGWTRISTSDVADGLFAPRPVQARAPGAIGPTLRTRIYERDGWVCVECGTDEDLTIDHRMPRSRGGANDEENLQTMCATCNCRKGNTLPGEPPRAARPKRRRSSTVSVPVEDLHPRIRAALLSG